MSRAISVEQPPPRTIGRGDARDDGDAEERRIAAQINAALGSAGEQPNMRSASPVASSHGDGIIMRGDGAVWGSECPRGPTAIWAGAEVTSAGALCSGHGACARSGDPSASAGTPPQMSVAQCECDSGWEGPSCDVPLQRLIGGAAYAQYSSAKIADAITPKERGPSPPEGNQYVPSASVGRLVRPIIPLPLAATCACSAGGSAEWGFTNSDSDSEAIPPPRGGVGSVPLGALGRLGCNEVAARRLLRTLWSFAAHSEGGLGGFSRVSVVVVAPLEAARPLADKKKKGANDGKGGCPPLSDTFAAIGGGEWPWLAAELGAFGEGGLANVCASLAWEPAALVEEGATGRGEGLLEEQQRRMVYGLEVGMRLHQHTDAAEEIPPFVLLWSILAAEGAHEHTNLRLAISQLLTTGVDVLGFNSLYPLPPQATLAPPFSSSLTQLLSAGAEGGVQPPQKEYLFVSECWDVRLGRWVVSRRRPLFGYRRHERYTMLCEGSSADVSALLVRQSSVLFSSSDGNGGHKGANAEGDGGDGDSLGLSSGTSDAKFVLRPAMGSMAFMDLYIRLKYDVNRRRTAARCLGGLTAGDGGSTPADCFLLSRADGVVIVGTCAECLVRRTATAFAAYAAVRHTNTAFAKAYLVESIQGGIGSDDAEGDGDGMYLDPFAWEAEAPPADAEAHAAALLAYVSEQFLSSRTSRFPSKGGDGVIAIPRSLTPRSVWAEARAAVARRLKQKSPKGGAAMLMPSSPASSSSRLVACAKAGGAYGPSRDGRYASYCQRLQRRRDFAVLHLLWTTPHLFQPKAYYSTPVNMRPRRRYALSLHAGNLFGALRIEKELLWETDGDFDLVAFDDGHEGLVKRFGKLLAFLGGRDGSAGGKHSSSTSSDSPYHFEVKPAEDGKPWYASILRGAVDFQLNARSVLDPRTRGKPPHVHNVSVLYEGARVFVNGFQNPWQGVRSAPGHDYRRLYLAQQKWTPNRHRAKSIECSSSSGGNGNGNVTTAHLCMPPCNALRYRLDRGYCDAVPPDLQWRLSFGAADDARDVA